jgi:hypothetical protein
MALARVGRLRNSGALTFSQYFKPIKNSTLFCILVHGRRVTVKVFQRSGCVAYSTQQREQRASSIKHRKKSKMKCKKCTKCTARYLD